MRLSKTIPLNKGRFATVHELTVAEVRQLLSEHSTLSQAPTLELLRENHGEAKQVLSQAIELPKGETLDDLPLSEWLLINSAFIELNQALFQLAAAREQVAATQDRPSNS